MALTGKGAARRRKRIEALERPEYGWIWKPLLAVVVLYLLVTLALGIWWSRTPPAFEVEQAVAEQRGADGGVSARGTVTVASLMTVIETLLEKPGGYLRNDVAPPGLWLDNMPAWEYGVLQQARRLATALPAMEQSQVDTLVTIQERLQADSTSWLYPGTERQLEKALSGLDDYLGRLEEHQETGFGHAGQGLVPWLEVMARDLDDLGLRLSASVGNPEALRYLDIEAGALPAGTPWYRVDNVFYEARGQGWALMQLLKAMQHDQADVLEAAGVTSRWTLLLAELERSQRRLWSPMVLNGSGFGVFANHSLVLANHMVRARDLARELAERLAQAVPVETPSPASPVAPGQATAPEPARAAGQGTPEQPTSDDAPTDAEDAQDAPPRADAETTGQEAAEPEEVEEASDEQMAAPEASPASPDE
ncbi:DUF2333 family protein [Halomonas cerina]|uniref:DUF2333 family protein n=1 Tax=Halomonas cerina TaxID=447424 RepID=A0A839V5S9_9GAMM|nr:DUF2333 family protein [Halomonas cerina]MBB3189348.1 hypothetical protein [Halomonas cerina]